ncbi:ataxin-2-like protein [Lepisosteus oculatus]|uniref:ataxin-2-like protein n=1 Tax=Lepisosteus oculatus TaxID=7918 RepID=UPI003721E09F
MLKQQPQPGSGGRKAANGTSAGLPSSAPSSSSSGSSMSRAAAGRSRGSAKVPQSSSPVFDGVYNNARMLHFLTAVVGSTCDVRVRSGSVYEGIFKTLSSQCELAVDAVHQPCADSGQSPRREDIVDTMIFRPADLVTMTCRDVDLSFATRDSFTDSAIGPARLNGEHREKILQRWEDTDSNGETCELDSDTSNGWDASEMFRFNEENYGVKSTYDSSLSMYTVALERGSSELFRQREARAARLASEIESSPQYRRRVSLENDEGRSEEDKYGAVSRDRDSPGFSSSSREGRYVPQAQRTRDPAGSGAAASRAGGGERGGPVGGAPLPGRIGGSGSPRTSSPRSSPSTRGAGSHPPGAAPRPTSPPLASAPPAHPPPHAHPHPDSGRAVNGVSSRMSPKSQRPVQPTRTVRTPHTNSSPAVSRSPKPGGSSQESPLTPPYLDSPVSTTAQKSAGPAPLFPVDVNEILSSVVKERTADSPVSPLETKSTLTKVCSGQQRSQLEELRKFGKEFRLQSTGGSAAPAADSDLPPPPPPEPPRAPSPAAPPSPAEPRQARPGSAEPPGQPADRQSPETPPATRTPSDTEQDRPEGVTAQVKRSTLNPNAKEFNPNKPPLTLSKPTSAPTPPRPTPPSPSVAVLPQPSQGALYNTPYLSYVSQIQIQGPSVQAPQMYQYTVSTVGQGKYTRAKGSVVTPRSDHSSSAPPMLQAASAAGPPLVASPYSQSYLQFSPQQYSQQAILQAMTHYPGQPMYSMLQGGARMLGSGAGHHQTLGPPGGPQFPGQSEGPPGPQQGLYAPQSYSHHPPQPSSTPTVSQQPPQHPAPSQAQSGQAGPQPSLYHSAPTPPNLPPGHAAPSPQGTYPLPGYSLHSHQPLPHSYHTLGQLAQAHVQGTLQAQHHSGSHPPHQVMLLHAPQQGPNAGPTHPSHGPQQTGPQHYAYIGHPQAVQVQTHPAQVSYHPAGN